MRTTPALRTLAAALLTGSALTVLTAAAGTSAAAPPTHSSSGDGSGGPVPGTVVSRGELSVRQQPTAQSPVVAALAPGDQDRVQCVVRGQSAFGDPDWYWLVGARGWAAAVFVDTGGQRVPGCPDPFPGRQDASGSWTFTGSASWSRPLSGTATGSWDLVPGGR